MAEGQVDLVIIFRFADLCRRAVKRVRGDPTAGIGCRRLRHEKSAAMRNEIAGAVIVNHVKNGLAAVREAG